MLAERERRLAGGGAGGGGAGGGAGGAGPPDAVQLTNDLVDEIRQAVSEANARGSYLSSDAMPLLFYFSSLFFMFGDSCTAFFMFVRNKGVPRKSFKKCLFWNKDE